MLRLRPAARRCACGCGVIGTRSSPRRRSARGARRARARRRRAARRRRRGRGAAAALAAARGAPATSPLVSRPPLPDAGDRARVERVLVDQVAHRRAERADRRRGRRRGGGAARRGRRGGAGGAAARCRRGRAARGAAARRGARRRRRRPRSRATTSPTATVAPAGFRMRSTPARSAGSSMLALSVSSSSSTLVGARPSRRPASAQRTIVAFGDRLAERRDAYLERHRSSSRSDAPRAQRANARSTSSASSAWCTLYEPVAGLAAASRPTYVSVRAAEQQRRSAAR